LNPEYHRGLNTLKQQAINKIGRVRVMKKIIFSGVKTENSSTRCLYSFKSLAIKQNLYLNHLIFLIIGKTE